MWYTYALQSLKNRSLYIGISSDPEDRLKQHNFSMTKSTRSRRPFEIIYKEQCESRIEARKREKYLKSGVGREFLQRYKKY